MKNQFETGATTSTVNELILWIETDQASFELIEKVYRDYQTHKTSRVDVFCFQQAVAGGISRYKEQFPNDHKHVEDITLLEIHELQRYFSFNYSDWSNENSYLSSVDVIFEDAKHNYSTSMSKKTTEKDAKEYFIGRSFNVGSYPKEIFAKPINIKFHAPTYTV